MTETATQSSRTPSSRGPLNAGGALVAVLSIATSALAYGALPGRMRVHWSFGGPYYGPEFAPTLVVLAAFSLLIAGFYVGGRWLGTRLERTGGLGAVRSFYDGCVLLVLVGTLCMQVVVVWANLG